MTKQEIIHLIHLQKKGQQRWEKAVDSAEKSNEARDAYKTIKKRKKRDTQKNN